MQAEYVIVPARPTFEITKLQFDRFLATRSNLGMKPWNMTLECDNIPDGDLTYGGFSLSMLCSMIFYSILLHCRQNCSGYTSRFLEHLKHHQHVVSHTMVAQYSKDVQNNVVSLQFGLSDCLTRAICKKP